MRTKTLMACLAAAFLTSGQLAWSAGNPASTFSHVASFQLRYRAHPTHRPSNFSKQDTSGVIPRAIRGGNPLQMLSPLAPAKYGTAEESVSFDPDVPGKGNGINLFGISF